MQLPSLSGSLKRSHHESLLLRARLMSLAYSLRHITLPACDIQRRRRRGREGGEEGAGDDGRREMAAAKSSEQRARMLMPCSLPPISLSLFLPSSQSLMNAVCVLCITRFVLLPPLLPLLLVRACVSLSHSLSGARRGRARVRDLNPGLASRLPGCWDCISMRERERRRSE